MSESNLGDHIYVQELKDQYFELARDVRNLNTNKSPVFQKYFAAIVQSQNEKHEKLKQWKENEERMAEEKYKGELYSYDCDSIDQKEMIRHQMADYIFTRAERMRKTFPEAFDYFVSQGYKFPFDEVHSQTTNPTIPKYAVLETRQHLIDVKDTIEDLISYSELEEDPLETSQSEMVKFIKSSGSK